MEIELPDEFPSDHHLIFASFACAHGVMLIKSHIMRKGTPVLSSFGRAMNLLQLIVRDCGQHPVKHLAKDLDIPNATVYRLLATLTHEGLLQLARRGHYVAGPQLLSLASYLQPSRIVAELARERLSELAAKSGSIAHLGMIESDMVTYLVKEGRDNGELFTREGMQHEAYCTAIGKVLLAELNVAQRELYLASGPFVALTPNTTVDVTTLREELDEVKKQGFAVDDHEISPDLFCLAVPVISNVSALSLGISLSRLGGDDDPSKNVGLISLMRDAAHDVGNILTHQMIDYPST